MSRIKDDSELQHALAHLWLSVDYAIRGEPEAARYELDSIEGLIFFDDEADRLNYLKGGGSDGREPMPRPAKTKQDES